MEKNSSFKKAPLKIDTTIRKEAPTGNAPMGAIPPKAVISRFPQVGGNRTTEACIQSPLSKNAIERVLQSPVSGTQV